MDAGVIVELVAGGLDPDILDEQLAAPHLIDSEVTSVLRRLVLRRELTEADGEAAFRGFLGVVLTRFRLRLIVPACGS